MNVFPGKSGHARIVSWWCCLLLLIICMAVVLQGCDHRPAPVPKLNPHPRESLKLKIIIGKSTVNRVDVHSLWTVGNLGCAPIMYPSGAERLKQIDVPEWVEKVGDNYVATIVEDRFLPDECRWINGGVAMTFMHDDTVLALDAINGDVLQGKRVDMSTCVPPPRDPPICFSRDQEAFLRNHFIGVFDATVELMK